MMNTGGLSRTRLGRMHDIMAGYVERGEVPGIVTLVSRRGEVHVDAIGKQSFGGDPMRRDTIFRIASMTKPITAVATMILVEECMLRLDESVDRLLPELADRKVLQRLDGPLDDTLAFSRMLLNKGQYGNERILSRLSVELMTTDHISPEQKAVSPFFPNFWDTRGWGFGLSIVTRRDSMSDVPGRFGWDGGYGTSGYADPKEDMVTILMTQSLGTLFSPLYPDFWTSAYQTIDD